MAEKIGLLELEGLAINGFVESFTVEDCAKEGKIRISKLKVKLTDGRDVETECVEYPRLVRVILVLNRYLKWGKYLVTKEITEEMMSGITYDIDHKGG